MAVGQRSVLSISIRRAVRRSMCTSSSGECGILDLFIWNGYPRGTVDVWKVWREGRRDVDECWLVAERGGCVDMVLVVISVETRCLGISIRCASMAFPVRREARNFAVFVIVYDMRDRTRRIASWRVTVLKTGRYLRRRRSPQCVIIVQSRAGPSAYPYARFETIVRKAVVKTVRGSTSPIKS